MRWIGSLLVLAVVGQWYGNAGNTMMRAAAVPATCTVGDAIIVTAGTVGLYVCTATNVWTREAHTSEAGVPSGAIVSLTSGTCPTGWTEVASLNGKMLRGTVAANADVGTTGGNATITPAGTNTAPAFTGNSVVSSAVSAGTPAGTNASGTVTPLGTIAWPAGVPTHSGTTASFAGNALGTHAHELPWQIPSTTTIRQIAIATFGTGTSRAATAVSAAGTANTTSAAVALSQAVTAGTPAGTVSITSQGTIAWPAGVPTLSGSSSVTSAQVFTGAALATHTHTTTATGTNTAPVFTGNAVDPSPPYLKVIFCSKT